MICIHFQEENFKICEDKTGGQAALSSMVYLYLAHIGSGFLLETDAAQAAVLARLEPGGKWGSLVLAQGQPWQALCAWA